MHKNEIQIVTFDNPYPPDFGGAIDVFYKIKALSDLGVKIYLHIYFDDRHDISGLKPLCETINLYKREKSFTQHLSWLPYGVITRDSKNLIKNLNKSEAPILFESLRTTGILRKHAFKQKIAVRCHNLEHDYSWGLFKSEANWFKKIAFFVEGFKYKKYEAILKKAHVLFSLSYYENYYNNNNFKDKSIFIPVFQGNDKIESINGFGKYALYHGDLSISDNIKSALFVINVFKDLNFPLKIASSTEVKKIVDEIDKHKNMSFELITDYNQLTLLINEAHINTLYSYQKSGTKLKVINALFKGRFCVLNKNMIDDPDVLEICKVSEGKIEYKKVIENLLDTKFEVTQKRIIALQKYNSKKNAEKIIKEMF
ncbi:MAG: hypothetical protein HKO01_11165 [Flaviramulus sp.]|nr:hypothetical protein [Flaviramulus sp.]NNC51086.1 hypothetical protein [Flaviramulus sp.]